MLSKRYVRNLIHSAIIKENMHMTIDGDVVPHDCEDCINDLDFRINDMVLSRNKCQAGTAARAHYSGVLNDLRKKRRRAIKHNVAKAPVDDHHDDDDLLKTFVEHILSVK